MCVGLILLGGDSVRVGIAGLIVRDSLSLDHPPACVGGIARCDTAACLVEGIILDSNSTSVVST